MPNLNSLEDTASSIDTRCNVHDTTSNGDCITSSKYLDEDEDKNDKKNTYSSSVIIVGAGISGLIAASILIQNGFKVTILEAQDRVGGRIYSLHHDDGFTELGAQWIHGQDGNPVYKFALENNLLEQDPHESIDDEKTGLYCTNTGHVIDSALVKSTLDYLDKIKDYCSSITELQYSTIEDIFRSRFNEFKMSLSNVSNEKRCKEKLFPQAQDSDINNLESKLSIYDLNSIDVNSLGRAVEMDDLKYMDALLEWYFTFEKIDNACDSLSNLSIKGYTEYIDCPGLSLVNFKNGYSSIIDAILLNLPTNSIKLNHQVDEISYGNNLAKINVKLTHRTEQGTQVIQLNADHCILTASLGVLKSDLISFNPPLPIEHRQLIDSIGYGTINKIFLQFDSPFWPTTGQFAIKLIWIDKDDDNSYPNWVYDMTGFDVSRNHKSTLIGWIGGQGAREIETESEETISTVCYDLLKKFLGSNCIRKPIRVFYSKWFTNPFFQGSYSHPTRDCESYIQSNAKLSEPIYAKVAGSDQLVPRLIIAGEATDPGEKATHQLIQFAKSHEKKMKNPK